MSSLMFAIFLSILLNTQAQDSCSLQACDTIYNSDTLATLDSTPSDSYEDFLSTSSMLYTTSYNTDLFVTSLTSQSLTILTVIEPLPTPIELSQSTLIHFIIEPTSVETVSDTSDLLIESTSVQFLNTASDTIEPFPTPIELSQTMLIPSVHFSIDSTSVQSVKTVSDTIVPFSTPIDLSQSMLIPSVHLSIDSTSVHSVSETVSNTIGLFIESTSVRFLETASDTIKPLSNFIELSQSMPMPSVDLLIESTSVQPVETVSDTIEPFSNSIEFFQSTSIPFVDLLTESTSVQSVKTVSDTIEPFSTRIELSQSTLIPSVDLLIESTSVQSVETASDKIKPSTHIELSQLTLMPTVHLSTSDQSFEMFSDTIDFLIESTSVQFLETVSDTIEPLSTLIELSQSTLIPSVNLLMIDSTSVLLDTASAAISTSVELSHTPISLQTSSIKSNEAFMSSSMLSRELSSSFIIKPSSHLISTYSTGISSLVSSDILTTSKQLTVSTDKIVSITSTDVSPPSFILSPTLVPLPTSVNLSEISSTNVFNQTSSVPSFTLVESIQLSSSPLLTIFSSFPSIVSESRQSSFLSGTMTNMFITTKTTTISSTQISSGLFQSISRFSSKINSQFSTVLITPQTSTSVIPFENSMTDKETFSSSLLSHRSSVLVMPTIALTSSDIISETVSIQQSISTIINSISRPGSTAISVSSISTFYASILSLSTSTSGSTFFTLPTTEFLSTQQSMSLKSSSNTPTTSLDVIGSTLSPTESLSIQQSVINTPTTHIIIGSSLSATESLSAQQSMSLKSSSLINTPTAHNIGNSLPATESLSTQQSLINTPTTHIIGSSLPTSESLSTRQSIFLQSSSLINIPTTHIIGSSLPTSESLSTRQSISLQSLSLINTPTAHIIGSSLPATESLSTQQSLINTPTTQSTLLATESLSIRQSMSLKSSSVINTPTTHIIGSSLPASESLSTQQSVINTPTTPSTLSATESLSTRQSISLQSSSVINTPTTHIIIGISLPATESLSTQQSMSLKSPSVISRPPTTSRDTSGSKFSSLPATESLLSTQDISLTNPSLMIISSIIPTTSLHIFSSSFMSISSTDNGIIITSTTSFFLFPSISPDQLTDSIVRVTLRLTNQQRILLSNPNSRERTMLEQALVQVYLRGLALLGGNAKRQASSLQARIINVGDLTSEGNVPIDIYLITGNQPVQSSVVVGIMMRANPQQIAGYEVISIMTPLTATMTTASIPLDVVVGSSVGGLVLILLLCIIVTCAIGILVTHKKKAAYRDQVVLEGFVLSNRDNAEEFEMDTVAVQHGTPTVDKLMRRAQLQQRPFQNPLNSTVAMMTSNFGPLDAWEPNEPEVHIEQPAVALFEHVTHYSDQSMATPTPVVRMKFHTSVAPSPSVSNQSKSSDNIIKSTDIVNEPFERTRINVANLKRSNTRERVKLQSQQRRKLGSRQQPKIKKNGSEGEEGLGDIEGSSDGKAVSPEALSRPTTRKRKRKLNSRGVPIVPVAGDTDGYDDTTDHKTKSRVPPSRQSRKYRSGRNMRARPLTQHSMAHDVSPSHSGHASYDTGRELAWMSTNDGIQLVSIQPLQASPPKPRPEWQNLPHLPPPHSGPVGQAYTQQQLKELLQLHKELERVEKGLIHRRTSLTPDELGDTSHTVPTLDLSYSAEELALQAFNNQQGLQHHHPFSIQHSPSQQLVWSPHMSGASIQSQALAPIQLTQLRRHTSGMAGALYPPPIPPPQSWTHY